MRHSKGAFGSGKRPNRTKTRSRKTKITRQCPSVRAITESLSTPDSILVILNSLGGTGHDHNVVDDQLAQIALIQSCLVHRTLKGKEIAAIKDEVGFPPFTFSKVFDYYPSTALSLAQGWEERGMELLLPFRIYPVKDGLEDDPRQAILYGVGDLDELEDLEEMFVEYFDPYPFISCFTSSDDLPETFGNTTKFFVQWELSDEEAAAGLGFAEGSTEFAQVMEVLYQRDKDNQLRKSKNDAEQERDWSHLQFSAPSIQS